MLPSPSGCWLDPRGYSFSRPQCVHCYYSPVTRDLPWEDLVDRLRRFCFHPLRYPNYGALTSTPAGLSPAEHASLHWTHNRTCRFPASGSRTRHHAFWRVTPSAVSERFSELLGCPISRSLTTSCVGLELRPLPSPGVTRLQRYYEPLRHPSAPGLSLTGVRLIIPDHALGLPVLRALSLCTCCRHYPGAAAGRLPRSSHPAVTAFPGRGRRVGLHIDLFGACSAFRGRDGHCWPPPPQIRTCPIKASGSYLGCLTSKRTSGQG